jgi:tetratricopeptide (TPR) repeat protein
MKRWMFFIIIGLLGISACTTFHEITVVSPKAGHPYSPTKVGSLHPILKWKAASQEGVAYDVIIYEGIGVLEVYYRQGVKETEHKVEDLLKPGKQYYWAVRTRDGKRVSAWARYDYFLFGGAAYVMGKNLLFTFKTPNIQTTGTPVEPKKRVSEDYPVEVSQSSAEFHHKRAWTYINKGQYEEAISDLTRVIEIRFRLRDDLGASWGYKDRGLSYMRKDEYDLAISDFTEAIDINPILYEAYNGRGLAYTHKDRYEEAIADLSKAIGINPKYAQAYKNRGVVYGKTMRFNEAISDLNKAIEINPHMAEAYALRGSYYYKENQYEKAISDYNEAIEMEPDVPVVYYNRGLAYYEMREFDKALLDFLKARDLGHQIPREILNLLRQLRGWKDL